MYATLVLLIIAVVFVNGWTDAPNAITCLVSTGAMPYKKAVRMAAGCNLAGILVMSLLNASVADTIGGLVRLDLVRPAYAMVILCGAMCAVVMFAVGAWVFGIPTSESHALIAALTGAALATGSSRIVNGAAWGKVLWGLALSLALGFGLGWLATRLLGGVLKRRGTTSMTRLQLFSAGWMAFMHGAQDGQKFIAVFVLARCMREGIGYSPAQAGENLHILLLCAAVMALGTLAGGKRIIAHVGGKMMRLEQYQGACADLGGAFCLLAASAFGIPMSTTHTKTTAIMGAGAAAAGTPVNRDAIKEMFVAWGITFPVCGSVGYLLAGLFLRLVV